MEEKKENVLPHPFALFGIECGKGWEKIYMPLFEYIEEYNKGKDEEHQIRVLQVKEKYGELRFYTNFCTKELSDMIDKAEEESLHTCEICGKPCESIEKHGWIYTMCDECLKKHSY